MSIRRVAGIVVLWALSLVIVAVIASAQSSKAPAIVSGADIGFRIMRHDGRTPVGTLVVKVNGEWVEARFAERLIPTR